MFPSQYTHTNTYFNYTSTHYTYSPRTQRVSGLYLSTSVALSASRVSSTLLPCKKMNGITSVTAGTDLYKQDIGVSVYIVQPIRIQLLQMLKGIDGWLGWACKQAIFKPHDMWPACIKCILRYDPMCPHNQDKYSRLPCYLQLSWSDTKQV